MKKNNDSQSVSSLRDQRTRLDLDLNGAGSSTVSSCTSHLQLDSVTNRGIFSPDAIQSTKDNKQPVRRTRKKWAQEENRVVMECYYRTKPKFNACRQRMHAIWKHGGMFNNWTEACGPAKSDKKETKKKRKKQCLTNLELEEIQRRIVDEPKGHVLNDSENKDEQWFLGFDEKGGDVFLKDVRVVVEDIGNRHDNVEFDFRIKKELLEDEKEMQKNISEIRKLDRTRLPCFKKVGKGNLNTSKKSEWAFKEDRIERCDRE